MTDENVVKFYPKDAAKNPDSVLEQAIGEYAEVCVVGFDKDGNLDVRASLNFRIADILFCMDTFRHGVLNGDYDTRITETTEDE
jgi:hypothetical protein